MPRVYKRKSSAPPRATWTEEALREASKAIESKNMKLRTAARKFGIPPRTLRRRIAKADLTKHSLGKGPVLGYDNEKKLADLIENLELAGFPCTRMDIRRMAFELATKLKIAHNFNNEKKLAGKQWMQSFLDRNKQLSISQTAEKSRAQEIKEETQEFFDLWEKSWIDNNFDSKLEQLFNAFESEEQTNDKSEKVFATKDTEIVQEIITSSEKDRADTNHNLK